MGRGRRRLERTSLRKPSIVVIAACCSVLAASRAEAVTYIYWDSNGTAAGSSNSSSSGNWDTSSTNRWTTDVNGTSSVGKYGTTGSTKVAVFNAGTDSKSSIPAGTVTTTASLNGSVAAEGIVVKDFALTINASVNGGTLTVGDLGITIGPTDGSFVNQTSGDNLIDNVLTLNLSTSQTWQNNSSGNLTVKTIGVSPTSLATGTTTLTLAAGSSGNINFTGVINDAVAGNVMAVTVNSSGTGTVLLGNGNNYTGKTTLKAGKVTAGNTQAFGLATAPLAIESATIDLANDTSISAYNTTISGNATLTADRATNGAGITHAFGTLAAGGSTISVGAGAHVTSGTAGVSFGGTTLTGSPTFAVSNSSTSAAVTKLTLNGVTESGGSFGLTKTGNGTLELKGSNNYTGKTIISGGTLSLASGATIASAISAAGGTFDVSGQGGNVTLNGLSGSGQVQLASGQLLTVKSLGVSGSADALTLAGGGTNGGLTLSGTADFDINLSQNSADTITLTGQAFNYNAGTLSLHFSGATTSDETFQLLSAGKFLGSLASVQLFGLPQKATASFNQSSGLLTVSVPEPALAIGFAAIGLLARRRRS